MAKQFFLLTFLIFSVNIFSQDRELGVFRYSEKAGSHTAKLILTVKPFAKSKHKITFDASPQVMKIDGRGWHGLDGEIPRREITSMIVAFDGKKVVVPRSLFADCYEPNLGKDYFATKLSENGDSLLIYMAGSDAAGSYTIMWILRKDGHHSRFINDCSDCDYRSVFDFFTNE